MRLFIAINLNDEIKDFLSEAIRELKKEASGGNFTSRDNLHLTLSFLGELNPEKVADVKAAMNRVKAEPFRLTFSGYGKFKRRGGDIHWAGVERSEALFSLQKQLAAELADAGFSLEEREYSPHLTLGREVRLSDPAADPYRAMPAEGRTMNVSRISLMKSERIGGKLVYYEIYGKDLK